MPNGFDEEVVVAFQDPILLYGPTIRILIVTDDEGSFTKEHRFGLTELISSLKKLPIGVATLAITKAHREQATDMKPFPEQADIQGFRFDNPAHFDASDYDEIWLFGISSDNGDSLSQKELRIVTEFMDNGGGVFATGDHQDLGRPLCGSIPRVRSMRRWKFEAGSFENYNPATDDAPPVLGPYRHDTIISGHDTTYSFDDQSDDLPAEILPKLYGFANKYFALTYPHPLLCGPKGVIRVLPDHMHEGMCVVPKDLGQTVTFAGYSSPEYPGWWGKPVPDVIATGFTIPKHKTRLEDKDLGGGQPGQTEEVESLKDDDVPVNDISFGAIGAYDGHLANIGRVVVDSTFHHFVNINLNGAGSNSLDPVKQEGFLYSTEGKKYLQQIRAYFRNIALWLAPPAKQEEVFENALWAARWDSQVEMVAPSMQAGGESWDGLLAYGKQVQGAFGRMGLQCISHDWIFAKEHPLGRYRWWELINRPDPPPPFDLGKVVINPATLVMATQGAILVELAKAVPARDRSFRDDLHRYIKPVVEGGRKRALVQAVAFHGEALRETQKLLGALEAHLGAGPSARVR
jgi:hypothetical protein